MKTAAFLLATALLCRAALADFVLTEQVESPTQNATMTVQVKDNKTRMDVSAAISVIADTATGDTITLMHQQKSYMKVSAAAMKAMQEKFSQMRPEQDKAEPPKLTPTGRKETISGYATEEYTATVGSMKISYWITKDFPKFKQLLAQMLKMQEKGPGQAARNMMPRPEEFPGMPIRTETDLGGQVIKSTLVSISEKDLAASLFAVPADYTEMVMPAFNAQPVGMPKSE